ncbi:MAG: hypothetical protein H5U10_01495 [Desulfacinum sp.]|nr:hypothetical protein [Desulfacinum sp.]MBZ4659308.1 hypothetical protein [Desulfacinum sp.]
MRTADICSCYAEGPWRPSARATGWIKLAVGVFFIWLFMFVIGPWLQKAPSVKPLAQFIEESGIEATAFYYTEVEQTGDAEVDIRSTFRFMPQDP